MSAGSDRKGSGTPGETGVILGATGNQPDCCHTGINPRLPARVVMQWIPRDYSMNDLDWQPLPRRAKRADRPVARPG